MKMKPLELQTIVITGATSGIGLTTARMAAQRGARLVLTARNEEALQQVTDELTAQGAQVRYLAADVANQRELRDVAALAEREFDGFDTWVNNAGVSIFGRNEEVPLEDQRRLFETNFWGVVHGSLVAVEHLRRRGGGTLINLGSEVSDRAVPLQGIYSASKHAVKAFTESLRMELEKEEVPIAVTLIKPAAIDTLFVEHAKNYMEVEPKLPPPLYAPELAAEAILSAAEHPQRDIFVGGAAKMVSLAARVAPRWMDKYMERFMFTQQRSEVPERNFSRNSLHQPGVDLRERAGGQGHVIEFCPYSKAALNPKKTYLAIFGTALAATLLWKVRQRARHASF
jgi:short-subunit dehydrogenase